MATKKAATGQIEPEVEIKDPDAPENHGSSEPEAVKNRYLWDRLRRVDPTISKDFQRAGGFKGTAIKPSWQELMMTETFGPCGTGWGTTEPEYEIVRVIDSEILIFCKIGLWYIKPDGKPSELIWGDGGDHIVSKKKDGTIVYDDEGRKKCLTDAIGNAMKRIGMAADIHMGLWNDSKYKEDNETYFVVKKNPNLQPEAVKKFEAEVSAHLDDVHDLTALDDYWTKGGVKDRANEIETTDKAAKQRIINLFSARKGKILKDQEQQAAIGAEGDGEPASEAVRQTAPARSLVSAPEEGWYEFGKAVHATLLVADFDSMEALEAYRASVKDRIAALGAAGVVGRKGDHDVTGAAIVEGIRQMYERAKACTLPDALVLEMPTATNGLPPRRKYPNTPDGAAEFAKHFASQAGLDPKNDTAGNRAVAKRVAADYPEQTRDIIRPLIEKLNAAKAAKAEAVS